MKIDIKEAVKNVFTYLEDMFEIKKTRFLEEIGFLAPVLILMEIAI